MNVEYCCYTCKNVVLSGTRDNPQIKDCLAFERDELSCLSSCWEFEKCNALINYFYGDSDET